MHDSALSDVDLSLELEDGLFELDLQAISILLFCFLVLFWYEVDCFAAVDVHQDWQGEWFQVRPRRLEDVEVYGPHEEIDCHVH